MFRNFCFLLLMLSVLASGRTFAADYADNADESPLEVATEIIKLRMAPAQVADSAFRYIYMWNVQNPGMLHAVLEQAYAEVLIPFAEKNNLDKATLSRYYDELGLMQMRQGKERMDEAIRTYTTALNYGRESGDFFRQGKALEHLSLAESKYGDMAKGFELSQQAIEAYKKSDDDSRDRFIVRCYYYQAANYLQLEDLDGLGKVIANMKAFADEVRPQHLKFLQYNIYSVEEAYYGRLYSLSEGEEKRRYEAEFDRASLATLLLLDTTDPEYWKGTSVNPTWNYYNRAVMIINSNDRPPMDSIKYYTDKALAVNHDNKKDDILEIRLSVSQVLAEGWMKNGNYAKSKEILLSALDLLHSTEGINNTLRDKIEIYKNLQDVARQTGHYDDAFIYSDSVSALQRQLYSIDRAAAIKELEIKYQTQETELALSQSEARRANTLMWLFAVLGLLLVSVIIFVVYANGQRRRRMQREMEFARLRADIGRQLTQQYVEGLESERQRMSRELHDGVCNDLLAIQMSITGGKPMESTAALIDSCRESVRRISHELMPPEFAYASIDEVVRFFMAKQAEAARGRIDIRYSSDGADWPSVPDATALEVYRIVQEAVGNAVKHSGASVISVSLTLNHGLLTAEIADNGTYKSTGPKGLGMDSIRRRARAINGSVEVLAREDIGTTVTLTVKI